MLFKKQAFIALGLMFSIGFSWFYLEIFANQKNTNEVITVNNQNIDSIDVFMLQVGVFSSNSSMEASITTLNGLGYKASAYQKDDTYYIIASVLTDPTLVDQTKTNLTNLGFNVYVKQEHIINKEIINNLYNQNFSLLMDYMANK